MNIIAAYTSDEVILIVTALGGLVTIVGGVITSIIISLKNSGKLDDVKDKVNGAHTASQTEIKILQEEVKALVAHIAERKEEASLLAQSTAQGISQPKP